MSFEARNLRKPKALMGILTSTAFRGKITYSQVQSNLMDFKAKSFTDEYLDFLQKSDFIYRLPDESYTLTPDGLKIVRQSRTDAQGALQNLLGSYPPYRYHVQLQLAWLLLKNAAWQPAQMIAILNRIEQTNLWFTQEVLPKIQTAVGWQPNLASQYYTGLRNKILQVNQTDNFINLRVCEEWDKALDFEGLSDLTCADNICRFLQEQVKHPVRVVSLEFEVFDNHQLTTLLLLVLAHSAQRAVHKSALEKNQKKDLVDLASSGIQIKEDEESAALLFPVEVYCRNISWSGWSMTFDPNGYSVEIENAFLEIFPENFKSLSQLRLECNQLVNVFQALHAKLGAQSPFVLSALADGNYSNAESAAVMVNIGWQPPWDWQDPALNFHQTAIDLVANRLDSTTLKRPIGITFCFPDEQPVAQHELTRLIENNPYAYLLILLLIDYEQSTLSPVLVEYSCTYNNIDIIILLDFCLQSFGFPVWNDGYVDHGVIYYIKGYQLVELLITHQIAEVQFGQLRKTQSFENSLMAENAYLRNATRSLRMKLRQICQTIGQAKEK